MNARELATAFATQFAADSAFTAATPPIAIQVEQAGGDISYPRLAFEATVQALAGSGKAFTYTLTVWVESSSNTALPTDPDPALAHDTRVDLVNTKLLGTGKAALLTALNLPGVLDFRGWGATTSDPAIEASRLRTPVVIIGTSLVV